jgi:hypothetical protein
MEIKLDKKKIQNLDVELLKNSSRNPGDWLEMGQSEYRLYSYLSTFFNNSTILDIGTRSGGSALALSYNDSNQVISYDLVDHGANSIQKSNITWKIMNFMEDETIDWSKVSIIVIDVDPHDGIQERVMMDWLRNKNWKGILLHDDIGPLWPETQNMWEEIPEEKFDVIHLGHLSGTGIVNFGGIHKIIIS